jgi:hypothetical protein
VSAFDVAAAIAALEHVEWLPPVSDWEIAREIGDGGCWVARAAIRSDDEFDAYTRLTTLARVHDTDVFVDSSVFGVSFEHKGVPMRAYWMRPLSKLDAVARQVETPEGFFRPFYMYGHVNGSGSDLRVFRVASVLRHPATGQRRAVGWLRPDDPAASWQFHLEAEGTFQDWFELGLTGGAR